MGNTMAIVLQAHILQEEKLTQRLHKEKKLKQKTGSQKRKIMRSLTEKL